MTSEQWAGVVFSLLVVVPVALMPMFGAMTKLLELRYSVWVVVPIIGGAAAGWLMRRRLDLMIFGAVAAYSGFWCAANGVVAAVLLPFTRLWRLPELVFCRSF